MGRGRKYGLILTESHSNHLKMYFRIWDTEIVIEIGKKTEEILNFFKKDKKKEFESHTIVREGFGFQFGLVYSGGMSFFSGMVV